TGHVVKRNAELLRPFGLGPGTGAAAQDIDALTAAPGGELYFSLRDDVVSPIAGALGHGDLLSDRGRVIKRNAELLKAFVAMPPVTDAGLDGIQLWYTGEIYFSIRTN